MYIKKDVPRAAEASPGLGINPKDKIILIDVDDIDVMPDTDDKGVRITDDIVMKEGCYAYCVYMTPGTTEVTSAAEGDPDNIGFTPSVKFNHPGNGIEVREFKTNNVNRRFIVIVEYCSGKPTDLIGSPCNPCALTTSYTGNKDGSSNEITLSQISKGDDIKVYEGKITLEEPGAGPSA